MIQGVPMNRLQCARYVLWLGCRGNSRPCPQVAYIWQERKELLFGGCFIFIQILPLKI